ncbi:ferredoxin [Salisaeta longa]|uniref:ferredoxin n=1 Tax=Salisaeta longa TaxID=503170 RepID=UPI0003B6AD06|nr:ferredoxin [Salisaeta longa]
MADHPERTIHGVTVAIDRSLCIGSGNCVNLAPDVFEIADDNIVAFTDGAEAASTSASQLVEACAVCPVDALIATDDEGEQIVP